MPIVPSGEFIKRTDAPRLTPPAARNGAGSKKDKTDDKPSVLSDAAGDAMSKLLGLVDKIDVPPHGPIADCFHDLAAKGYQTSNTQIHHAIQNFRHRRESFVTFDQKPGLAYSFASERELRDFSQSIEQPQALSDRKRALLNAAQSLEQGGSKFLFTRKGFFSNNYVETDARGAWILMQRGEKLTVLDRYGSPQTVKSSNVARLAAHQRPLDPSREPASANMRAVESKGYATALNQELPEDIEVFDFGRAIKWGIKQKLSHWSTNDPQHPLRQRETMVNTLTHNGYISVTAPPPETKDENAAAPIPRVYNERQLAELAAITQGKPTAQARQFMDDMKAIREQKPLVMSRVSAGMLKGELQQADDTTAYLNLLDGGEMVLLQADGRMQQAGTLEQVHQMASGHPPAPPAGVDPKTTKTNLLMIYHDQPFDPQVPNGTYEDFPLRTSKVGSNENLGIVTLRSDLPHKKNLRLEYVQKDNMQLLETLDPKRLMSDPKLLEDFVYNTLKQHPDDKRVRLVVGGHGGAELGLEPDGETNDASAHGAMAVEDFADAIHNGLQRFNKETGQSRKIDNLITAACLMGNAAFIYALSKRGDVKMLSASPEMEMGNAPTSFVAGLADANTADKSAEEFAVGLVDAVKAAPAFPDGKRNLLNVDSYGAYDLSPNKGSEFKNALSTFFHAALAEPQYARYIKEDIAACPTYGGNILMNLQYGIQDRDVIQVARQVQGDARIKSRAIKQAARDLVAATQKLVLAHEETDRYKGREGPTLYLPVHEANFDERYATTALTKETDHDQFLHMIFAQPFNRTLFQTLQFEMGRLNHEMKEVAKEIKEGKKADGADKADKKDDADKADKTPKDDAVSKDPALKGATEKVYRPWYTRLYNATIATPVTIAATAAGAAAGTALAAIVFVPAGALLGIKAGLSGRSMAQRLSADDGSDAAPARPKNDGGSKPSAAPSPSVGEKVRAAAAVALQGAIPERARQFVKVSLDLPHATAPEDSKDAKGGMTKEQNKRLMNTLAKGALTVAFQAACFPLEAGGELTNRYLSYKFGSATGTLVGGVVGLVSGIGGGALSALAVGGLLGGGIGAGISRKILGPHD